MRVSRVALQLTILAETGTWVLPLFKIYRDELNRPAIGYGHTIVEGEEFSRPLTQENAVKLLADDLQSVGDELAKELPPDKLHQHQMDAVVCWAYHARQGRCSANDQNFKESTLVKLLKNNQPHLASAEFDNWVFLGDRFFKPFAVRRNTEKYLFTYGHIPGF